MRKDAVQLPRVLLVEDRLSLARCYAEFLADEECELIHVDTGEKALQEIQKSMPVLILLDLQLPDMNGTQILTHIKRNKLPIAVVVITAHGSYETSRVVMHLGASDYLEKPFTRDRLCVTVRNTLERLQLESTVRGYRQGYCGFIGSSTVMQGVYNIIENAAVSTATVFITGESGTGKEVCAQAIHQLSDRKNKECVTLNCAAIPGNLMESEIFGHVKGAFTGAVGGREGAASRANGGTLFLDEIGEMNIDLQSKLLRFIQTGQFQKVGSNEVETVNVRFICATNRDPLEQVRDGSFREDLYYRLLVVPIHLPPLRDRDDDIIDIANNFLKKYAQEEKKGFLSFSPETQKIFKEYAWPGNVRQLLNVVRNIVVLHDGEEVGPDILPAPLEPSVVHQQGDAASSFVSAIPAASLPVLTGAGVETMAGAELSVPVPVGVKSESEIKPLWQVEYETIEEAIEICGGSVTRAAKLLKVSPSTIYRKRPVWEKERVAAMIKN